MRFLCPQVVVGVPTFGTTTIEWSLAFASIAYPLGAGMRPLVVKGERVDEARNQIVKAALELNADYVLFLADDVIAPPNIFMQQYERDVDICTGIYWTKSFPKHPYIWRGVQQGPYTKWKHGEFFQVDMAGCDALLVKTDVFRKIEPPWFSCKWTWEPDTNIGSLTTEDFYFFLKAMNAGYKVWADTCVMAGHQDRHTGVIHGLTEDMPQARHDVDPKQFKDSGYLCADIGAGLFSEFVDDGTIVRFDTDDSADIRCDIRMIPEPDEKYDEVRLSHVLEHFPPHEVVELLKEWLRILKPGGTFRVKVPDFMWAMERILEQHAGKPVAPEDIKYAWDSVWGSRDSKHRDNIFMAHRNGFTKRTLENLFRTAVEGLESFKIETPADQPELRLTAIKKFTPKAQAVMEWWNGAVEKGTVSPGSEQQWNDQDKLPQVPTIIDKTQIDNPAADMTVGTPEAEPVPEAPDGGNEEVQAEPEQDD